MCVFYYFCSIKALELRVLGTHSALLLWWYDPVLGADHPRRRIDGPSMTWRGSSAHPTVTGPDFFIILILSSLLTVAPNLKRGSCHTLADTDLCPTTNVHAHVVYIFVERESHVYIKWPRFLPKTQNTYPIWADMCDHRCVWPLVKGVIRPTRCVTLAISIHNGSLVKKLKID